jgi:hypothetical protein
MKKNKITAIRIEQLLSVVISTCLFVSIALYVSLIALTMTYASTAKEFTQRGQQVKSDIAALEADYFKRTSTLAITDASSFGLTQVTVAAVVDPYANLTYATR